jgi:hypothetical protein
LGTYRIVPIGTWVVSPFSAGGEENASGSRATTFSVRFLNHGVREDVDVEGGEGEVVVRSIWTASLSYLFSSIYGLTT